MLPCKGVQRGSPTAAVLCHTLGLVVTKIVLLANVAVLLRRIVTLTNILNWSYLVSDLAYARRQVAEARPLMTRRACHGLVEFVEMAK
jgi:hypothetical protein